MVGTLSSDGVRKGGRWWYFLWVGRGLLEQAHNSVTLKNMQFRSRRKGVGEVVGEERRGGGKEGIGGGMRREGVVGEKGRGGG